MKKSEDVETRDLEAEPSIAMRLLAGHESPLAEIERTIRPFQVTIARVQRRIAVTGQLAGVVVACEVLSRLAERMGQGRVTPEVLRSVVAQGLESALQGELVFDLPGVAPLTPGSLSQVAYMEALLTGPRPLIFGIGPTGTGKTYLAIAAGLSLLAQNRFRRLVLTRAHAPLESVPMTREQRLETIYDEQFAPLEDALVGFLGRDEVKAMTGKGLLEVMPLGRMRGRTFSECLVLIDDAQNMSAPNMRMALTRLGRDSRMVVTGDAQAPVHGVADPMGLSHILGRLEGAEIASVHRFAPRDIMRHEIVASIEAIYRDSDRQGARPT
jgi:phosphate starvation-inducible PhoH-like protein